ncbi:hypothetical protein PFICI_09426 [Pestalotiopsis fici W106-1]|uniref:Uncharacterized protein n=1 Tax=Pestalotiopsis fici (strain W106-1 / CGMCC3.15140) TaxID=1229662 RepID=W3X0A8_PESFW|nr:uncharacterized protein PFICI_09426 [Pestalotiopsis fici W106-1]ETS79573.1 hypothetical protein PFICI_09426 [Pestalotiopsis fici W106-1]
MVEKSTKKDSISHHPNAEAFLQALSEREGTPNVAAVLLEVFKPQEWFSEESKAEILDILSNLKLDTVCSSYGNFRKVRDCLKQVNLTGERISWDPDRGYEGLLPSYEAVEATRIVGSKIGGFGTLPQTIDKLIKRGKMHFLLENPDDRKTPIHEFWVKRVKEDDEERQRNSVPRTRDDSKNENSKTGGQKDTHHDAFSEDEASDEDEKDDQGDQSVDDNEDLSDTTSDEEDMDDDITEAKDNTLSSKILSSKLFISMVSDAMSNAGLPVHNRHIQTTVKSRALRDALQEAIANAVKLDSDVHRQKNEARLNVRGGNGGKKRRASSSAVAERRKSARSAAKKR